ncbi:MAG: hypothetical protein QOD59_1510, partial [Mycobacterium sp.]|nr:hypothetical protein [Mycobacterium sp.]
MPDVRIGYHAFNLVLACSMAR